MRHFDDQPEEKDLRGFVWAVYALQLLTLFTGGLSFIVAGVIAYLKYDESIGTMEQSHFSWQVKTLWVGLTATIVGVVLLLIWIGTIVLGLTQLWIAYRVIKGGFYLSQNREIKNSGFF
ncbi:MAG: hypothetical protein U9R27_02770 [Campylobacterota bacterium]|nr:hypothetical protein [Campylobacterota bacterium]